jgi:hypothetical protein
MRLCPCAELTALRRRLRYFGVLVFADLRLSAQSDRD